MELYKRTENYANPVRTAMRNFFALGLLLVLASVFLYAQSGMSPMIIFLAMAVLVFAAAMLLKKNKIMGVYFGWIYIVFAAVSFLLNGGGGWLGIIVAAYAGYWNYKAYSTLKNTQVA
ncbi:MAG: hypothetical protein RLZZ67_561 [Candidatus Parcubacteria bacterium]|jgi:hypothetical protein